MPANISALHDHDLISFAEIDRAPEWRFGLAGKPAIRIEPRLIVNTADAAIAAAVEGMGIARVLSCQAIDAIAAGTLVALHDDVAPPPIPVHLVDQASRLTSVNVRAFVEAARDHFSGIDLTARSQFEVLDQAVRP